MRFRWSRQALGGGAARAKRSAGRSDPSGPVGEVYRVELPSGGWWDIFVRPTWAHLSEWSDAGDELVDRALVSLTAGWSFSGPASVEAIASRDPEDLIAVLEAFKRCVAPYLATRSLRAEAEELFAALMSGQVPAAFVEAHLMAATGWSWQRLQETPADIVRRMGTYLAVARAVEGGGALNFENEEEHG
ncbi:MAG: hypothetical protein IH862_01655 [Chloroflexi bacterium]|nr:hypothetical protein [Chloroflexota bacterium]